MGRIRVLVVDCGSGVGLRGILAEDPDLEVVGECRDDRAAVSAIRNLKPDLLLLNRGGSPAAPSCERLMIKSGGRISFLKAGEIDWVEAQGDYICIHAAGKKHLVRQKISEVAYQLPSGKFLRIHRSTIVNIDCIKEMHPLNSGEYAVILNDGMRLVLSRSFREKVFEQLTRVA